MPLILLALLTGVLAAGCRAATVPSEAAPAPALAVPPATATRPVILATIAAPADAVAIALPAAVASVTPPPTATEPGQEPTPGPPDTSTPTPQPTFTPPALPNTPPWEHYWFRRPVPEGGVVWTDKVYPYGSTRGDTLRPHHGVEFNVGYDTPVLAAASGTVLVAGEDAGLLIGETPGFYGQVVVVEHDTLWKGLPVFTLYGHLNEVLVSSGQRVETLAPIGLSGATGVADGPHLHFEVRVGRNSYEATRNPLLWLYPFPDRGTVAGRVVFPDGSPAYGAPVSLHRVDAPTGAYFATTTYAGDSVNPDDDWQENFAIDDVYAGYYEVVVDTGEKKIKVPFWVFPFRTNFVEIILE